MEFTVYMVLHKKLKGFKNNNGNVLIINTKLNYTSSTNHDYSFHYP